MTGLFDLLPWWWPLAASVPIGLVLWRFFGVNGLLAALFAGAVGSVHAHGVKAGKAGEREKQRQADDRARQTIHEIREDVRSIPSTPAGEAKRNERFNRWSK